MKYCADTWFILKAFSDDPRAVGLIEDARRGKTRIVIPIIVLAETIKKLMQGGKSKLIIDQFFDGVIASEKISLVLVDREMAEEAARVSITYGLSLIDSFIAATANLTGCDILLSGDEDYDILVKRKYLKVQSW